MNTFVKHEASGKFSARSTSHENLKNAPAKTKAFKYHKAPHSTTPIKIGKLIYCADVKPF